MYHYLIVTLKDFILHDKARLQEFE